MENMYPGTDGQLSLATLLLLTGGGGFGAFGRGGVGGVGGGYGPHAGGYGGPSIADEVAVHNLKTPTTDSVCEQFRDLERAIQSSSERNSDGTSRLVDINRELQLQASKAQADLRAEVARCCCETQKEVLANRCANEKAICDQTNVLTVQATANAQAILNQLTGQETDRLNRELGDCKAANSNLMQTNQIAAMIGTAVNNAVGQITSQCCCDPCSNSNGNGNGHGKGKGVDFAGIAQVLAAQGWTPPGQAKK